MNIHLMINSASAGAKEDPVLFICSIGHRSLAVMREADGKVRAYYEWRDKSKTWNRRVSVATSPFQAVRGLIS